MTRQTNQPPDAPDEPDDFHAELVAERDRLQRENENLRGQLAAAAANRVATPVHTFQLSQGQLAELEATGRTNVGGKLMDASEVRSLMPDDQRRVEIATPPAEQVAALPPARPQGNTPGVDYVWPSVRPGAIDPAVAGTPGINGPAADAR